MLSLHSHSGIRSWIVGRSRVYDPNVGILLRDIGVGVKDVIFSRTHEHLVQLDLEGSSVVLDELLLKS